MSKELKDFSQEITALRIEIEELKQASKPEHSDWNVESKAVHTPADSTLSPKRSLSSPALSASSLLEPAKLVAWLGASAGGLSILLGGLGFLAIGAHDAMLGIPRTLQVKLEYIIMGSLFFSRSVILVVAALLAASKGSWLILGSLMGVLVGLHLSIRHHYCRVSSIIILFAAAGLICAEFYALWYLTEPLQFEGILLYASDDSTSRVLRALLKNEEKWLRIEYGFSALLVFCLAIALRRLEQVCQSGEAMKVINGESQVVWRWIRIPAFGLLIICCLLLPRSYGILTLSNEYPQVTEVTTTTSNSLEREALSLPLFLLREDKESLVLYDPLSHSMITLVRESVEMFRVSKAKHVFGSGGQK